MPYAPQGVKGLDDDGDDNDDDEAVQCVGHARSSSVTLFVVQVFRTSVQAVPQALLQSFGGFEQMGQFHGQESWLNTAPPFLWAYANHVC
jgi:hypothetical protein